MFRANNPSSLFFFLGQHPIQSNPCVRAYPSTEPKVGEDDVSVGADQDVVRLQVAVHDAVCVEGLKRQNNLHIHT